MNRAERADTAGAWEARAACRGVDTNVFFTTASLVRAKRYCRSCPVRQACLTAALEEEQGSNRAIRSGVRGGLTADERKALEQPKRRQKPRRRLGRRPAPCGTQGAWERHKHHGEPIDQRCAEAHEEHLKQYRERRARQRAKDRARAGSEPP